MPPTREEEEKDAFWVGRPSDPPADATCFLQKLEERQMGPSWMGTGRTGSSGPSRREGGTRRAGMRSVSVRVRPTDVIG